MSRGGWMHADSRVSSCGDMKCTACGQSINEGDYRYRQKSSRGDWHYQSQHRACSESDPAWAEMDAIRKQSIEDAKAMSRACREFKATWGVDELDDYIQDDDGTQEGERHE